MLKRAKDNLYYYFVTKNSYIKKEYEDYVIENIKDHNRKRLLHWVILFRLNWHYRIRRETTPLLGRRAGASNILTTPYMKGPESAKGNRQDPYHFAAGLMKYDVISFDVFDTLILRNLNNPIDLFAFIGEALGVYNFTELRRKCENEMRKIRLVEGKSSEITLSDIYDRIEYYSGIDSRKGQTVELEKEMAVCVANPYMYEVFQILKSAGKRIYAVSDMYLPKNQMETLLNKCGYDGFADILVSCDYYCNKSSGRLFKILKGKVGANKYIVHIGDNQHADIEGAKIENIDTRYYRACREIGNEHRCPGMSASIRAAYDGIINTTLHNGIKKYSLPWEYGFCYGGLVSLGYINWIYKQAKKDGVDKILFAARDGYTIKQIYDTLKFDIPNEYIFWSRLASLSCISSSDRYYFLCRNILELEDGTTTVQECLDLMGLSQLERLCKDSNLPLEVLLVKENKMLLCDILVKNWEEVTRILLNNKTAMLTYVRKLIGDAHKVAIIDIGWSSQNLIPLFKMLKEELETEPIIYMLGSRNVAQNPVEQLNGKIRCYMFSSNHNRLIYDRVAKERNNLIMESLFFAPQCSFEKMEEHGNFLFVVPEIGNHDIINEMTKGILEFCEKYIALSNELPALMNISGYDSFIPIRALLDNKNYVKLSMQKLCTNMKMSKRNDDKRVLFSEIF